MVLEIFVEKEIGPRKYLAIIGTGQSSIPSYVIGLEYAFDDRRRLVKLLPPGSPKLLSVREAIKYYHSIHSEEEFDEECERARGLH